MTMVVGGFMAADVPSVAGLQPDYMKDNDNNNTDNKMNHNNNTTAFIPSTLLKQLQKKMFDAINL